jgi:hypothetical protein
MARQSYELRGPGRGSIASRAGSTGKHVAGPSASGRPTLLFRVSDTPTRREGLAMRIRALELLMKTSTDPALRRTTRRTLRALTAELAAFDTRLAKERT